MTLRQRRIAHWIGIAAMILSGLSAAFFALSIFIEFSVCRAGLAVLLIGQSVFHFGLLEVEKDQMADLEQAK